MIPETLVICPDDQDDDAKDDAKDDNKDEDDEQDDKLMGEASHFR